MMRLSVCLSVCLSVYCLVLSCLVLSHLAIANALPYSSGILALSSFPSTSGNVWILGISPKSSDSISFSTSSLFSPPFSVSSSSLSVMESDVLARLFSEVASFSRGATLAAVTLACAAAS